MKPMRLRVCLRLLGVVLALALAWPARAVTPTPTPKPTAGYLRVRVDSLGGDAVAEGAQWRRAGTSLWRRPDAMETMIPMGTYTVEFRSVEGYIPPASQVVVIEPVRLTTAEGTYSKLPCSIKVIINPPEAIRAGAFWKREGAISWIASGWFDNGLQAGNYNVIFKSINGWLAPDTVTCTVAIGKQTLLNVTYLQLGSLRATIVPPEAVTAGAQWRRIGTSAWLDSGATEINILPGDYQVEFKPVPLWTTPAAQDVTIVKGVAATPTGAYTPLNSQLAWSTYLGGSTTEYAQAVAIDTTGTIYVCGTTLSEGWVSGGLDTVMNDGAASPSDAFAVKISPSGQHLWSTYLGGAGGEYANGIALDAAGDIAVTGYTYSPGWIGGGYNTTYGGNGDGFVVKLSAAGAHLWSTYLGGTGVEAGFGIAAGGAGEFCVVGETQSRNWISGGFDTGLGTETSYVPETAYATTDGFAVKLSAAGAHLWSTYLGEDGFDQARAVAVDPGGNVCVAGVTASSNWIHGGYDASYNGKYDGFLIKLSPLGQHLWSSYLGGYADDFANGVAADGVGNLCVTGDTQSGGWAYGGYDVGHNGMKDIFVARFTPAGSQPWSTYLGGGDDDEGAAVAFDSAGDILLTGRTRSAGWIAGEINNTFSQGGTTLYDDAFVAKLSAAGAPLWSTYLGGTDADHGRAIAVNAGGVVAVAGYSRSPGWVAGGYDLTHNGDYDGFVAVIFNRLAGH